MVDLLMERKGRRGIDGCGDSEALGEVEVEAATLSPHQISSVDQDNLNSRVKQRELEKWDRNIR